MFESFPQLYKFSVCATLVGTPLQQHSLLRGSSGNITSDIMIIQKPSNWGWMLFCQIFMQDLPKLGLDLIGGTTHAINVHVFLRTRVSNPIWWGSMKLIKSKTPIGLCHLNPCFIRESSFPPTPHFSGECTPESDQIFRGCPLKPFKACIDHLVFWQEVLPVQGLN